MDQQTLNKKSDLLRFKKLLEYFVAHVEFCQKTYLKKDDPSVNPSTCVGYDEYVAPYIVEGDVEPLEMDEWKPQNPNAIKNKKIKGQWDSFDDKEIRMVVRNHFGRYSSTKCFLDWGGWRNINNVWNKERSSIVALKIRRNVNESLQNPKWVEAVDYASIESLGLFDGKEPNKSLEDFFDIYLGL